VLISRYQSRWSHGAHISVALAAEWHIYILIITVRYVGRKLNGRRWKTMEKLTNGDKEIPTLFDNAEYWLQMYFKLKDYENLEEQGRLIKLPCKVGDTVYLIDRDENNKFKVYEGKWKRVSLVQASKDGSFNLRGEISYDIYDCFYDDGRIMKHGMYVGQEHTKIGEVVFLTKSEAEAKLKELVEV
jgi:hypothetical protein